MKDPLVTVIIPVYNTEKYLRRCLGSVLAQTYRNFELILVVDDSPDNSPQICDEHATKDDRIVVIHEERKNVSLARNVGLDNARGEFVTFVDSDDYLLPLYLESLVTKMSEDVDAVFISRFDERENERSLVTLKTPARFGFCEFKKNYDDYDVPGSVWAKLYRRELIGDIRFDGSSTRNEDFLFNFRYYSRCRNFASINEAAYVYNCSNPSSLCHFYKTEYFRFSVMHYEQAKLFLYGVVAFRNDREDHVLLRDGLAHIQYVCYERMTAKERRKQIDEVLNEPHFRSVLKIKSNILIKDKIPLFMCRFRLRASLVLYYKMRKAFAFLIHGRN